MDTAFLIKFLGAIFAIMTPFVNLPMFLSLTDGMSLAEQRRAALRTVAYSGALCAVVAVAGTAILGFFGISVDDFRVAGGLVLMIIGLGMLNGSAGSAHHGTSAERAQQDPESDPSFYPLAFPILVGPGTITTIVVFTGQAKGMGDHLAIALALAGVLVSLGVVMFFAASIGRYLSQTLRVVMIRIMGMILAAIAVEMIASGLKALLPGLA